MIVIVILKLCYKHNKSNQNFIIKESFPRDDFTNKNDIDKLDHVIKESEIYKHLSILPLLNITPCIYKGFDVVKIKTSTSTNLLMLNETGNSNTKIISLQDFLIKISDDDEIKTLSNITEPNINILKNKIYQYVIPNILFQFLYTMECLNNIKFKHNDLHLGNILIEFNTENILNEAYEIKNYNKFIVTKKNIFYNFNIDNEILTTQFTTNNTKYPDNQEYLVPDIGINIKIFDFDNSILFDNKQEPTIICEKIYNTTFKFNDKDYLNQSVPPNIKNNTIPNNIDDIYSNIIFSILNTIIEKIPYVYKDNYKIFYNKLFNTTNEFTKTNFKE